MFWGVGGVFWGVGGNCSNGFCYYRTFKYDGRFGPQLRTLVYCLPDGCLLVLPAALLPGLVVVKFYTVKYFVCINIHYKDNRVR